MTIVEKNEIIAQYMGYEKSKPDIQQFNVDREKFGDYYELKDSVHTYLDFHENWKSLMDVVIRLEEDKHPVYINSNNCTIYTSTNSIDKGEYIVDEYGETKIEATYNAVFKFINNLQNG